MKNFSDRVENKKADLLKYTAKRSKQQVRWEKSEQSRIWALFIYYICRLFLTWKFNWNIRFWSVFPSGGGLGSVCPVSTLEFWQPRSYGLIPMTILSDSLSYLLCLPELFCWAKCRLHFNFTKCTLILLTPKDGYC